MKYVIVLLFITTASCNWAKEKTKETVNKTGEVVAKTGSEFVDGMKKGIEKTFQQDVVLSETLKAQGITTGKIIILGTDSSSNNILSAYFIFDQNFDRDIMLKVYDEKGEEYGRLTQHVSGKKGNAKYIDFVLDKRTNVDGKGKLSFE